MKEQNERTLINIGIDVHISGTIFAGTRVLDQRQNEQQVSEKYITEVENNFSDNLKVSFSAYSVYPFLKGFVLSSSAHKLPVDLLADNEISDSTLIYLLYNMDKKDINQQLTKA